MKISRRQLRKLISEVAAYESGNRTEFLPKECAIALGAAEEIRNYGEELARAYERPFGRSIDQIGLNMKEKLINCVLDNTNFLAKDQTEGEATFMNLVLDNRDVAADKEALERHGRQVAQYGTEPQSGKSL